MCECIHVDLFYAMCFLFMLKSQGVCSPNKLLLIRINSHAATSYMPLDVDAFQWPVRPMSDAFALIR